MASAETGLVDQLTGMGFEEARAKAAVARIANKTLDAAIDWLSANEATPTEDLAKDAPQESTVELMEEGGAETAAAAPEAKSLVCQDCDKQMRNMAEAELHAAKSGHANFAESAEEKKPLTPEERQAQTEKLQKLIAEKKAARLENERKEAAAKEKKRVAEGKSVTEIRKELADKEIRDAYAERKRQKEDDKAAKKRVLEQIALDKANRAAAANKSSPAAAAAPPAVKPQSVPAPPKVNHTEARIQIRMLDGGALTHTFQATEQLAAVRLFAQLNRKDGSEEAFRLMTTFPRRLFTDEDMEKPLKELGLVPNAVLVATKATM